MQRFPHASWKEDPLLPALIGFIGLIIMLSFVYTCINTVKAITTEKEKQLKVLDLSRCPEINRATFRKL
jgi:ATP-binding cassette subfamily A (ABC1) protein 3